MNHDELSWVGVQKNKICYQANAMISKENVLDHLVIENYEEKYFSEMRIMEVSGGQGPNSRTQD